MNRLLATVLEVWNVFLAVAIVITAAAIVGRYGDAAGYPDFVGYLAGAIIGIVVAATVCGLISVLTLIEQHLRFIAESAEYQNVLAKIKIDQRD